MRTIKQANNSLLYPKSSFSLNCRITTLPSTFTVSPLFPSLPFHFRFRSIFLSTPQQNNLYFSFVSITFLKIFAYLCIIYSYFVFYGDTLNNMQNEEEEEEENILSGFQFRSPFSVYAFVFFRLLFFALVFYFQM